MARRIARASVFCAAGPEKADRTYRCERYFGICPYNRCRHWRSHQGPTDVRLFRCRRPSRGRGDANDRLARPAWPHSPLLHFHPSEGRLDGCSFNSRHLRKPHNSPVVPPLDPILQVLAWHLESPLLAAERVCHQADFLAMALRDPGEAPFTDWNNALKLGHALARARKPASALRDPPFLHLRRRQSGGSHSTHTDEAFAHEHGRTRTGTGARIHALTHSNSYALTFTLTFTHSQNPSHLLTLTLSFSQRALSLSLSLSHTAHSLIGTDTHSPSDSRTRFRARARAHTHSARPRQVPPQPPNSQPRARTPTRRAGPQQAGAPQHTQRSGQGGQQHSGAAAYPVGQGAPEARSGGGGGGGGLPVREAAGTKAQTRGGGRGCRAAFVPGSS